ncbi:MAG TPA: peptidoglycan DD-metalloendopeptidase family protein [Prolixibacteraceae bacterium]|nr:peptidoglycan DD-metalloendopeptidase family protein [Prolixibacteraceae bacterium]
MKKIFFLFIVVCSFSIVGAQHIKPLKISYVEVADGLYDFYASNPNYFPIQLELKFTDLSNMEADCDLPYVETIARGKHKIFTLRRVIIEIPGGFDYEYNTRMGAYPVQHKEGFAYRLPVEEGKTTKVIGFDLSGSRTPGKILWGFEMEEGDAVCAARSGVVAMLTRPRWRDSLRIGDNTVTILHSDDTFGKYELMADSSVVVAVGDTVEAGDIIGEVGVTRFTRTPHTRFSVYYVKAPIDSINAKGMRNIYNYVNPCFYNERGKKIELKDGMELKN